MSDIFISAAPEDRERARSLEAILRSCSRSVARGVPLPPDLTIGGRVENARCVVVVWTAAGVGSARVSREASFARRQGISVGVLFDRVELPSGFAGDAPLDFTDWDGKAESPVFEQLVAVLGSCLAPPGERQFRKEVLPDELAYVADRRASHGIVSEPLDPATGTGHQLVGIALSGGGIRSATFNLGILQAVHRRGLWRLADYLSTVSGGGFIGSALTAFASEGARKKKREGARKRLARAETHEDIERNPSPFPFKHIEGASETEAVQWLRGHSDYLAPRGLMDYLRAFALFARGLGLNLLLLLPVLLIVSLLGSLVNNDTFYAMADTHRQAEWVRAVAWELENQSREPMRDMRPLEGVPGTTERAALEKERQAQLLDWLLDWFLASLDLDWRAGLAALEEEPPLIEADAAGSLTFVARPDWSELAARLAQLEVGPTERVLALHCDWVRADRSQQEEMARGDRESGCWKPGVQSGKLAVYGSFRGLRVLEFSKQNRTSADSRVRTRPLGELQTRWPPVGAAPFSPDGRSQTRWTPVAAAAFSPDGRYLAAAGLDGTVLFFDVNAEVASPTKLDPESERALTRVAFSRDDSDGLLLTARGSGAVKQVWRAHLGLSGSIVGFESIEPPEVPLEGLQLARSLEDQARAAFVRGDEESALILEGEAGAVREELAVARQRRDSLLEGIELPRRRSWDPRVLHLPKTIAAGQWVVFLFVLLYPLMMLFAEPLERLLSGLRAFFVRVADRSLALRSFLKNGWRRPFGKTVSPQRQAGEGRPGLIRAAVGAYVVFVFAAAWSSSFLWSLASSPLVDPAALKGELNEAGLLAVSIIVLWVVLSLLVLVPALRAGREKLLLILTAAGAFVVSSSSAVWIFIFLRQGVSLFGAALIGGGATLLWGLLSLPVLIPVLRVGLRAREPERGEKRQPSGRLRTRRLRLIAWFFGATHLLPLSSLVWLTSGIHDRKLPIEPIYLQFIQEVWQAVGYTPPLSDALQERLLASLFVAGLGFALWKLLFRLVDTRPWRRKRLPRVTASSAGWRERYERWFVLALLALAALALFEIQPYLVTSFQRLKQSTAHQWAFFAGAASFLVIVVGAMLVPALKGMARAGMLVALGLMGPLLPALVYLNVVATLAVGEKMPLLHFMLYPDGSGTRWFMNSILAVGIAFGAYLLGQLVDANLTSMHGFYRDRLSQAYLVGLDSDGRIGPENDVSLCHICPPGSGAPYHLLNASLNMQGESAGAMRWRKSDFFVFSKHWCGGPRSQYCRSEQLEYLSPGLHLGAAMAVSGAAASPNMGTYTSGALVMLMTLLNVRLGLWLPNPRRVRELADRGELPDSRRALEFAEQDANDQPMELSARLTRWRCRLSARPSGYYLIKEMGSRLDSQGRYVNLSDGGHLENTGAFELLRRRCRLIVICDGESDADMRFGSLAALMRYARIDLGVTIEIDLKDLRPRSAHVPGQPASCSFELAMQERISRRPYALGEITYPALAAGDPPETGTLLYLKSSITGKESEIIREYRARNPSFPHESTADQVFEEDQFEAYRELGFLIGDGLFAEIETSGSGRIETWRDVENWLATLSSDGGTAADPPEAT